MSIIYKSSTSGDSTYQDELVLPKGRVVEIISDSDNLVLVFDDDQCLQIHWHGTDLRDSKSLIPCPYKKGDSIDGCCLEHVGCGHEYCETCYPLQELEVEHNLEKLVGQSISSISHTVDEDTRAVTFHINDSEITVDSTQLDRNNLVVMIFVEE